MAYGNVAVPSTKWHGECLAAPVNTSSCAESAPLRAAPRLPQSPRVRESLTRRGVALEAAADETPELFEARIETSLMALFRDQRGEEEFTALYHYAGRNVLRCILSCMGGQGARLDPQELRQDVFVNIYSYAGGFRDEQPRSFRVWSGAIARNVVRRQLGLRRRLSIHDLPEGVCEPVDPRFGPSARASIREERTAIAQSWGILLLHYAAAWKELSPRDQKALELIEVEGLSYSEACERLSVGMSNMKMIMFRARKRIRARIAAAMDSSAYGLDEASRLAG
jgi:RNA polymerase sigma factor (sigma-70 family)